MARAKRFWTETDIRSELGKRQGDQSQAEFSSAVGISQQMLSDVLRGKRRIPIEVADYLGMEEIGRVFRMKGGR